MHRTFSVAVLGKDFYHMINHKKIAVLGGDQRQWYAARWLSEHGYHLSLWGMREPLGENTYALHPQAVLMEAMADAVAVVLPLPASTDGVYLQHNPEAGEERMSLRTVLQLLPKDCILIGGKLPEAFAAEAEARGHRVCDYFENEAFQIKNAYITAEAAMSIAMNHLTKNLRDAHIAITGYGRIAEQLADLLLRLRVHVTVVARRESDLAWAESRGCKTLWLRSPRAIDELLSGYDILYNTVPSWLFGREFLERVDRRMLYVELASAPGGIDVCAAREMALPVFWASSLPGKYAPVSAGELIGECVLKILEEEESV